MSWGRGLAFFFVVLICFVLFCFVLFCFVLFFFGLRGKKRRRGVRRLESFYFVVVLWLFCFVVVLFFVLVLVLFCFVFFVY